MLNGFKVFKDERIPKWYQDPRVWDYLGRKYHLGPGGIIDDSDDKPPILVVESINYE